MRRLLPVMVVAALLLLAPGLVAAPRVAAQNSLGVTSWITIGATAPAVGCAVPIAVEVHASGNPVTQTEVSAALFVDDEVVAADRSVTDGGGVAYLTLDTSSAYAGANGWVDVNIAGAYVKGFSVLPGSDGGCSAGATMLTVEATIPNVQSAPSSSSAGGGFPTYVQQRNLSCEYAAIQIATSYWGNAISEYAVEEAVGWSQNPHYGYRGNITGWWGNTNDYGVYAEPLAAALGGFGFYGETFYAQGDSAQLTSRLDSGAPTLVWLGLWGDQSHYETGDDGVNYLLVAGMHVMVAYDYDQSNIYLSDPGTGSLTAIPWGDFMYMWNVLDGMSLSVWSA
ncbi:MAG: C39 family peptidase [Thermomicrobiales bacterium]